MSESAPKPKWRRRKEARPRDIAAAALEIFAEKGFAGARIDEIAARAGVSKGTLYLYFETKADIFRAVVRETVNPNIAALEQGVFKMDMPFADLIRTLLPSFAEMATATPVGRIVKMVVGESRNFPELAKVWHDDVVEKAVAIIASRIARGQARGEVRPGDPRVHAFSIMGPMLLGVLWRETFTPVGAPTIDLVAIARQHAETILGGLLVEETRS